MSALAFLSDSFVAGKLDLQAIVTSTGYIRRYLDSSGFEGLISLLCVLLNFPPREGMTDSPSLIPYP